MPWQNLVFAVTLMVLANSVKTTVEAFEAKAIIMALASGINHVFFDGPRPPRATYLCSPINILAQAGIPA